MFNESTAIETILGTTSLDEFHEEYWEKFPLHVERSNESHFSSLLDLSAIEELLSARKLLFPEIQVVNRSKPIDVDTYTDENRVIVPHRLIEHFYEGATIVVSQAQHKISSLARLCKAAQSAFMLSCQTNVYLSPGQNQGFSPHYDSHDVFILQVSGSKQFNFYAGGADLPYSDERFDSSRHACGEFQQTITLHAGDTLYIPRGVMHDAVALDETSLHITLGVYAITQRDVVLAAIEHITRKNSVFRQSIPSVSMSNSKSIADQLRDVLLDQVDDGDSWYNALKEVVDQVFIDTQQDCTNLLSVNALCLLFQEGEDFEIVLQKHHILKVENIDDDVLCYTPGQIIELKGHMASAFKTLLVEESIKASSLPITLADDKHHFLRLLIAANLLVCSKEP